MNKKLMKILKIIAISCIVILVLLGIYILYVTNFRKAEKVFFDSINSFVVTDKGYIAVGSNNNNNENFEKPKITRYNKNREKKWVTFFNKGFNGAFFDIAKDGDYYVAVGSFEANEEEHTDSIRTALLAKYDTDGKLVFSRDFQILGNSKFTKIEVVEDGYIVVGQSIFENMTLGFSEEGGGIIIKYDKEGNIVWQSNYGGSKSGLFNDFVIVDDIIYVVGKDAARVGIVVTYDMDGNRLLQRDYEVTDTIGFTGIVEKDGYLYVVGGTKLSEEDDDFDTDALIVKYDKDLNVVTKNTHSVNNIDRFNQIIVDGNGHLVVIGQTATLDKERTTKIRNEFNYSGILAKYRDDLVEIFSLVSESTYDDYFTHVIELKDNYLISGYSRQGSSFYSRFVTYSKSGKLLDVK